MLYYKKRALNDLNRIFKILINWKTKNKQRILTDDEVIDYHNRLQEECLSIEHLTHHFKPAYADHQKFGEYIHSYKPNSKNWYIIYDIDNNKDIRIKKIMSSGITKSAV